MDRHDQVNAIAPSVVMLPNGRRVAYEEHGDPTGRPVLVCHGLPGSRHLGTGDPLRLPDQGLRVISFDRAGIGDSDPARHRRLSDWAEDLIAFIDALGLAQPALFGVSAGAPFALAGACRAPDHVRCVVLLNGLGPLHVRETRHGMAPMLRAAWWFVRYLPLQARFAADAQERSFQRHPQQFARRLAGPMAARDRLSLAAEETQSALLAEAGLAFAQGSRAVAREMNVLATPWDFDVSQVRQPVHMWQGAEDRNVTPAMARWLASRIPDARLHEVAGMGHVLSPHVWPAVRDVLAAE